MAEASILDALDALKKLEESLRSRDAEFKERESSLQEQASKLDEDRRMTEQERTALAEERDSIVGREKGLRRSEERRVGKEWRSGRAPARGRKRSESRQDTD